MLFIGVTWLEKFYHCDLGKGKYSNEGEERQKQIDVHVELGYITGVTLQIRGKDGSCLHNWLSIYIKKERNQIPTSYYTQHRF